MIEGLGQLRWFQKWQVRAVGSGYQSCSHVIRLRSCLVTSDRDSFECPVALHLIFVLPSSYGRELQDVFWNSYRQLLPA